MNLDRIAELRREKGACKPSDEVMALLDDAEAWELLQEAGERDVREQFGAPCGWIASETGDLLPGVRGEDYGYTTPKAAVLAALRPKGAKT